MKKATILLTAAAALLFSCGEKLAGPSDRDEPANEPANAVIITLRSWQTMAEDFWDNDLDPRIYFRIVTSLGTTTTADFLNRDNVGQSWSGSVRGSAISIPMTSGNLDIYAVVLERDGVSGDDDQSARIVSADD